jgi:hypothetical protein
LCFLLQSRLAAEAGIKDEAPSEAQAALSAELQQLREAHAALAAEAEPRAAALAEAQVRLAGPDRQTDRRIRCRPSCAGRGARRGWLGLTDRSRPSHSACSPSAVCTSSSVVR